eukprot:COSAG02_NODE_856_length_16468_cov_131.787831_5_plen_232_part_00
MKDYLRDIGRDVASSLGEELKGVAKEKATSFVKEQFGLGFQDELKAAGRDILSSVGDELKGAARDKATSMIKEQFGLGVVDDLKSAGRRLRGKPTDAEMRERLKGIAGTLGQPLAKTDPLKGVRSAGTKMLLKQLGMDGGAIARPCSVKLSDLATRSASRSASLATRSASLATWHLASLCHPRTLSIAACTASRAFPCSIETPRVPLPAAHCVRRVPLVPRRRRRRSTAQP